MELLTGIVGEPPEVVETRMLPALAAGLLRRDDGDDLVFGHDLIRECLYEEGKPGLGAGVCMDSLDRLSRARPGGNDPRRLAELAFHFAEVETARKARLRPLAAEQALRASAGPRR